MYSFIILADIPDYASWLLKPVAAVMILLAAFGFYRLGSFLKSLAVFLFTNFLFLGIIIGIYLLLKTPRIAVNNSTVYFDIGARGLFVCAFFAYVFSCAVVRFYNRSLAKGEIFSLEIIRGERRVTLFALSDTGNRLREPFSGAPVIVASSEKLRDFFCGEAPRLIPASTVNSSGFLKAFRADKIIVSASGKREVIENAYVALSDEMEKRGVSAVINPEIISV